MLQIAGYLCHYIDNPEVSRLLCWHMLATMWSIRCHNFMFEVFEMKNWPWSSCIITAGWFECRDVHLFQRVIICYYWKIICLCHQNCNQLYTHFQIDLHIILFVTLRCTSMILVSIIKYPGYNSNYPLSPMIFPLYILEQLRWVYLLFCPLLQVKRW